MRAKLNVIKDYLSIYLFIYLFIHLFVKEGHEIYCQWFH